MSKEAEAVFKSNGINSRCYRLSFAFIAFTHHHIPLSPTAGVGMAGQQRQQVAVRLNFDFLCLVGLHDLNVSYDVGQRLP